MSDESTKAGPDGARRPTSTGSPEGDRLRRSIAVLLRRWWLPAAAVILCAGFVVQRDYRAAPRYTAEIVVQRTAEQVPLARELGASRPTEALATLAEVVTSRPVVTAVVDSLGLRSVYGDDAVERVRAGLRVRVVPGTNLIRARYTAADPGLAADVANGVGGAFRAHALRQAREAATLRREFVAEQLRQVTDSLARARRALLGYQDSVRLLDPETESRQAAEELAAAEGRVRELRFQERMLDDLLAAIRSGSDPPASYHRLLALDREILPVASSLYDRLQRLRTEREGLTASRFGLTEQRPEVQRLDSLIASTEAEIRGVTQESLSLVGERIRSLEARVSELQSKVGALPGQATRYARLRQRVEAVQDVFDLLVEKYYEAQIAEAVEVGDVEIVEPATVPARPEPRHTERKAAFAGILGLLLGAGGAFFLEKLDTRIRLPSDAEEATDLPVLSIVPRLDGNGGPPVLVNGPAPNPRAEAFHVLRSGLRLRHGKRARVVVVSSAERSAGKSTVAANLCRSLARSAERVLLVDGDLRRPVLHRLFDCGRTPGLTEVVARRAELNRAVRLVEGQGRKGLFLLPSGAAVEDPAGLLGGPTFAALLRHLGTLVDTVVVDAPPMLAAADAALTASRADGVLLVARAEQTERAALAEAARQLRDTGLPLLGVVVNDLPDRFEYRFRGMCYTYAYGAYGNGAAAAPAGHP